jgi:serine/threonine-protein kinase
MVVYAYSLGKAPAQVKVPKVVGMKKADADAAIKKLGLTPQTFEGYSDTVAAGVVAAQDPAAGASVKPGAKVAYMASLGKAPSGTAASITVTNVKGKSQAEAESAIRAAGLVPNAVKDKNSAAKGTVAGQMPPSGSKSVKGGVVGILVSLGEAPQETPQTVTVPNLKGKSQADAAAAVEELGLVPYSTEQPSADVPAGQVIDQLPAGGESVPDGWPVIFAVSSGTPPATPMSVPATQP